jgi:translocation and assembly module TamB
MEGQLVPGDLGLKLTLSTFEATPRKVPLRLAAPTDILIGQGAARLSNLVIAVGKGSIRIDGTAGSLLDLTAEVKDLPISLANAIVPDLAAEGALSAHVKITGQASMPQVTFDATAQDLATSQTRAAGLPQIDVTTKGHFADNGLTVAVDSRLGAQPLHASADVALNGGTITIAPLKAEIGKSVFSGTLALDAARQPSGKLAFDIPDAQALASIVGRKAEGAVRGTADIRSAGGAIAIQVDADGLVRKQAIKAKADVALDKGALSLPALDLTVGTNHLDGALTLGPDLLPSGALTFDFPDLALLAAMGGRKAEGALKGTAKITSESGKTDARIAATGLIRKQAIAIAIAAVRQNGSIALPSLSLAIGKNRLDGALSLDAGYLPTGKLTFDLPDIGLIAALGGQTATGSIRGSADIASTDGKLGGTVTARGERITALGVEIVKPSVDLKIVDLAAAQVSGKVTADRLTSGSNSLARLALNFNRSGAQTAFDLNGQYDGAPLVAKGAVADEADGMAVSIDTFSAAPRKIVVRLQKPTTIRIKDGAVSLSSLQISAGKGTIAVTGAAGGKLDLTAKITALPASLANAFASGLDAAGTISATVTAKGDPAAPVVAFDVDWRNAALAQTKSAGLTDFSVTAKGQMANNVVTLNAAARGASGLSLTAGGTVGIAGRRAINLKVNGRLPFAALGPLLARQGIDLKGDADFDLTVTGAATSPAVSGRISTSGATLTVIRQNLTIKSLAASVTLDGRQARIASLTGNLSGGGTVSASGTIGIAPNSGFPADLRIALKNAVYTDGKVVAAKLSGDLTVTGSLVASPTLGGKITLRRADITIPQKLPGTLAQLDIKHRHAPRDVLVQAERIRENRPGTRTGTDTGGLSLDLTIVAQRQIFVRGRGLDAELGGQCHRRFCHAARPPVDRRAAAGFHRRQDFLRRQPDASARFHRDVDGRIDDDQRHHRRACQ